PYRLAVLVHEPGSDARPEEDPSVGDGAVGHEDLERGRGHLLADRDRGERARRPAGGVPDLARSLPRKRDAGRLPESKEPGIAVQGGGADFRPDLGIADV